MMKRVKNEQGIWSFYDDEKYASADDFLKGIKKTDSTPVLEAKAEEPKKRMRRK